MALNLKSLTSNFYLNWILHFVKSQIRSEYNYETKLLAKINPVFSNENIPGKNDCIKVQLIKLFFNKINTTEFFSFYYEINNKGSN